MNYVEAGILDFIFLLEPDVLMMVLSQVCWVLPIPNMILLHIWL